MKACTKILHEMREIATRIDQELAQLNIRNVMYRTILQSSVKLPMPSSSDEEIEKLCNQIRHLCSAPFSEEAEEELRNLAKELAHAIEHHVQMARSSLRIKRKAILQLDMATD